MWPCITKPTKCHTALFDASVQNVGQHEWLFVFKSIYIIWTRAKITFERSKLLHWELELVWVECIELVWQISGQSNYSFTMFATVFYIIFSLNTLQCFISSLNVPSSQSRKAESVEVMLLNRSLLHVLNFKAPLSQKVKLSTGCTFFPY